MHLLIGAASDNGNVNVRNISQYNRDLVNRTLTFGNVLTAPTITAPTGAGYGRVKVAGSWTSEYGDAGSALMTQGSASTSRAWTVAGSRSYFGTGTSTFEFELFDFSGTAGFLSTYGLISGASTSVTTSLLGAVSGVLGTPSEGSSFKQASRRASITP